MSLTVSPSRTAIPYTSTERNALWGLWHPPLYSKEPRRSLAHHACGLGTDSRPLGYGLDAPGGCCLRQSLTDKRTVVEVQVSRKRVPAHHWRKSSTSWDTLEGKRNSLATHVTPPPRFAQMGITRQDDGINTNFRSVLSIH